MLVCVIALLCMILMNNIINKTINEVISLVNSTGVLSDYVVLLYLSQVTLITH